MRLVYEKTGKEVQAGDLVRIDDEEYEVVRIMLPHKPSSTGRVEVRAVIRLPGDDEFSRLYYPGVIGAYWIEREDQTNG